jgi:hypothetical protein
MLIKAKDKNMEEETNVFSGWDEETEQNKKDTENKESKEAKDKTPKERMVHIKGVCEGDIPVSVMAGWGRNNEGV